MKIRSLLLFACACLGFHACGQSTPAQPSIQATTPPSTFNCSLHLVVDEQESGLSEVLKWHPEYHNNPIENETIRVSTVDFLAVSSSGRPNKILESKGTTRVEIGLDGATSAKLSMFRERFPKGQFAFVVEHMVIALLSLENGLGKYSILVPVADTQRAAELEKLVKRNNGR